MKPFNPFNLSEDVLTRYNPPEKTHPTFTKCSASEHDCQEETNPFDTLGNETHDESCDAEPEVEDEELPWDNIDSSQKDAKPEVEEKAEETVTEPKAACQPERKKIITVEDINKDHALVRYGGKVVVIHTSDDEVQFYSTETISKWFREHLIVRGGEPEAAFKVWMESNDKKRYDKVVFLPGQETPLNIFNLWNGWGINPAIYNHDIITNHIKNVICKGNKEHYEYLMNWIAHIFQKPLEKPDVAVVLRGLKGTGKDMLARLIAHLVGIRYYVHIDKSEALVNKFNAQFEKGIFVHVEEAFFSADKSKKGILQSLISSPTTSLERKGFDVIEVPSYIRLFMTTNEKWAVPATADERRYFVIDVSDERKGDFAYFTALNAAITGDAARGFFHSLMQRDISNWTPREIPQTEALLDQKLHGLEGFDAWWYDLLTNAELPDKDFEADGFGKYAKRTTTIEWSKDEHTNVRKDCLRDSYHGFIRSKRFGGDTMSDNAFGTALKMDKGVVFGKSGSGKYRDDKGKDYRPGTFKLPPLKTARDSFEKLMGGKIDWPEYEEDEAV